MECNSFQELCPFFNHCVCVLFWCSMPVRHPCCSMQSKHTSSSHKFGSQCGRVWMSKNDECTVRSPWISCSTFSNQWIHQFYAPFISEKDWQYSTAVWSISKPNWPQAIRSGNCSYWYCFLMKPHLSVLHFAYAFAQLAAYNTPLWALPGCWTWFHVPQGQRPKHHLRVPGSVSRILVGWFKKPRNPVCQFVRSLQYSLHL